LPASARSTPSAADLLSERPIESGIDPGFTMLDDRRRQALADLSVRRWLQRISRTRRRAARILRRRSGFDPPQEAAETAMQTLREHRDFRALAARSVLNRNGRDRHPDASASPKSES